MEKAYIIIDDENTVLGLAKCQSRSQAIYLTYKNWKKDFGIDSLIEFTRYISCNRINYTDKYDFNYIDARDFTTEEEQLSVKILIDEIRRLQKSKK